MSATALIAVAMGGALGALARYGAGLGASALFGAAFPWGTLFVNGFGSLLMGMIAGYAMTVPSSLPEPLRLLIMTGFLGAFTTFSAFSLDAFKLWERGEAFLVFLYVGGSVIASITALVIGIWLIKQFI